MTTKKPSNKKTTKKAAPKKKAAAKKTPAKKSAVTAVAPVSETVVVPVQKTENVIYAADVKNPKTKRRFLDWFKF